MANLVHQLQGNQENEKPRVLLVCWVDPLIQKEKIKPQESMEIMQQKASSSYLLNEDIFYCHLKEWPSCVSSHLGVITEQSWQDLFLLLLFFFSHDLISVSFFRCHSLPGCWQSLQNLTSASIRPEALLMCVIPWERGSSAPMSWAHLAYKYKPSPHSFVLPVHLLNVSFLPFMLKTTNFKPNPIAWQAIDNWLCAWVSFYYFTDNN